MTATPSVGRGERVTASRDRITGERPADTSRLERLEQRAVQTERLASIGTLAAGIAHEINNPLMYVLANTSFGVETLDRHAESLRGIAQDLPRLGEMLAELAELRAALVEATEGVERVRTIVADLRRFARADAVDAAPISITQAIVAAARMSAGVVAPKALLRSELGHVPDVMGSEGMLVQVLTNVLVNAAEAMGDGASHGDILVRTRTNSDRQAVIEVLDDGPGFTPEALDRLFDPFFTTKPVGAGSGLGLSISHGVITAMGGAISASNRPEGGALVRIVLPPAPSASRAAVRNQPLAPSPASQLRAARSGVPRTRLLIVDDDPVVARSLVRLLRSDADATAVTSGRDAQALLARGLSYDVILCDLMMPEVSGAELYRWIARHRPDQRDKVIFLSGGATNDETQSFIECAATPCLTKPVPAKALRDIITSRAAA